MSNTESHNKDYLTIAVASDLHAFEGTNTPNPPSHYCISDLSTDPGQHPIFGLKKLCKDYEITADLFLSPGDLGDRATSSAISHAWKSIHGLADTMKAGLTAASSGNHDLDSRFLSSVDAKDALLKLEPPYPLPDQNSNFKYWARNYVIWEHASYRLVILNSSAHHGGAPNEIDHGRISDTILAFLDRELDGLEPKRVNILLCHHHPQQHMELNLGDYDVMKNGQLLLDLLGSGKHGRWLVIHGHKHHPKVSYAAGSSSSPVIFSAGSLCATLYRELQTRARNQFYLIKLPLVDIDEFGLVGEVDAWDWAVGDGWGPAASGNSGLPSKSYFGYRGDPSFVANKIASLLTSEKMPWDQVVENYREFQYLLPSDLNVIKEQLERRSRITIDFNNGQPVEVGKIMEP